MKNTNHFLKYPLRRFSKVIKIFNYLQHTHKTYNNIGVKLSM